MESKANFILIQFECCEFVGKISFFISYFDKDYLKTNIILKFNHIASVLFNKSVLISPFSKAGILDVQLSRIILRLL